MTLPPIRLGAHPSPEDPNDFPFHESELMSGFVSGEDSSPSILDAHVYRTQSFQDCVGFALAESVQAFLAINSIATPLLSPMYPYSGSRLLTRAPVPGQALPDVGCNKRNALKWARDEGYVVEDLFPESRETVELTPPQDVRQAGRMAKIKAAHRIMAKDVSDLRMQLRTALRLAVDGKACCPTFVMPVYDNYTGIGSAIYTKPAGGILGYHAQPIMSLDAARDAAGVPGSWGEEVGDNGLFRISLECLFAIGSEIWVQEIDLETFNVVQA